MSKKIKIINLVLFIFALFNCGQENLQAENNKKTNSKFKNPRMLIVYYSFTNNTKGLAEKMAKKLNCDILRIETVKSYPKDLDKVSEIAKEEVKNDYKPELKPIKVDLKKYDTIIIGTPVWWYTFPPAFNTFLSKNDLSGKKVYAFATNIGWLGHTFEDIRKKCGKLEEKNCLNVKFKKSDLVTPIKEIEKWIHNIK